MRKKQRKVYTCVCITQNLPFCVDNDRILHKTPQRHENRVSYDGNLNLASILPF